MSKKHNSELERLETWDTNQAEIRQSQKQSRVVFSVAFRRDDFDLILKYAEFCGMKTSEFIREAAIGKALGQGELLFGSGSQQASWIIGGDKVVPTTTASGSRTDPYA